MKVNREKLKNEIEEIIAYGAAYSEEVDLTTTKVMGAIEPLVIAVTELSPESETERLKAERETIHEQYKGMGLDILCLTKMLGDRKLSSTEKVVLENIRQSQSKRLRVLKDLPSVDEVKAEREWILCDDDMPELNETVWITNGCGWTDLGCLVECEGGYCWAVTNGIIYEEDGKIISECELDDDYDVVYWHRLPNPPNQ